MVTRFVLLFPIFGVLFGPATQGLAQARGEPQEAQPEKPVLRVEVNLVLLNVAVTDSKGRYVTGLRPSDFEILEDNIPQKIASFAEGNEPQRALGDAATAGGSSKREPVASTLGGANVFILFDTSNYMYRGFALAQDAI